MATPVKMPRVSKAANTGEVLEWLKAPGETVRAGEPLLRVLSEKATVEIEAPADGVVLQIIVPAGQEVPAGTLIAWIGAAGEQPAAVPAAPAVAMPRPVVPSRPSPAPAPAGPPPARPIAAPPAEPAAVTRAPIAVRRAGAVVRASPAVRRRAAVARIDLRDVAGSGPTGAITLADLEAALAVWAGAPAEVAAAPAPPLPAGPAGTTESLMATEPAAGVEREPLRGVRRAMAERMALSKRTAADVTTFVDVDMGAVRDLRAGVPVTYTGAVVCVAGRALRQFPILNASLDGPDIVYHTHVHVGVAVDTPEGLTVVTIADADAKPLGRIDDELRAMQRAIKDGHLQIDEMESPTFTVTNSGVLGSLMFTPIINPPQSAVLGMGKLHEVPAVRDGQIVVRPVMYLCLTYDHRLIEGAEAVRFLQLVKSYLEQPYRML